jgi:hypothetical protein
MPLIVDATHSHPQLNSAKSSVSISIDFDVYQPRKTKASAYYHCVEDHFELLDAVRDNRYQSRFGFWRPYVTDVIQRYNANPLVCTK